MAQIHHPIRRFRRIQRAVSHTTDVRQLLYSHNPRGKSTGGRKPQTRLLSDCYLTSDRTQTSLPDTARVVPLAARDDRAPAVTRFGPLAVCPRLRENGRIPFPAGRFGPVSLETSEIP